MERYTLSITIFVVASTALVLGRKYFGGGVCRVDRDLSGKVVIVTGGTAGIGEGTVRELARYNATVVMAARKKDRADEIIQDIKKANKKAVIEFMHIDLGDLESIKEFVKTFKKKYEKLDVLVNNAGALGFDKRRLTKDGFEMTFGVNHIGHFYLTVLLLDSLKKSEDGRVVMVASKLVEQEQMRWDDMNFEKDYSWVSAYGESKIANVLFSKELQKKVQGSRVKAVSLHPGVVRTEIWRYMVERPGWKLALIVLYPALLYFFKTQKQGAQTSVYCATEDWNKLKGEAYYADCKEKEVCSEARNEEYQKRLWDMTEKMICEKLGQDAFKF